MADHHLLLFPTLDETFGYVLPEAFATGLDVVTTATRAIPEIVAPEDRPRLIALPVDALGGWTGVRAWRTAGDAAYAAAWADARERCVEGLRAQLAGGASRPRVAASPRRRVARAVRGRLLARGARRAPRVALRPRRDATARPIVIGWGRVPRRHREEIRGADGRDLGLGRDRIAAWRREARPSTAPSSTVATPSGSPAATRAASGPRTSVASFASPTTTTGRPSAAYSYTFCWTNCDPNGGGTVSGRYNAWHVAAIARASALPRTPWASTTTPSGAARSGPAVGADGHPHDAALRVGPAREEPGEPREERARIGARAGVAARAEVEATEATAGLGVGEAPDVADAAAAAGARRVSRSVVGNVPTPLRRTRIRAARAGNRARHREAAASVVAHTRSASANQRPSSRRSAPQCRRDGHQRPSASLMGSRKSATHGRPRWCARARPTAWASYGWLDDTTTRAPTSRANARPAAIAGARHGVSGSRSAR